MEHDDPRRDDLRNCSTCQHGLVCRHRRGVEDALEGCPLAVAFGGADHVIDALAQGCGAYLPDEHAREDRSADVRGYVEGLIVPDVNRFSDNPAEILRDMARRDAADSGGRLTVDEESFDRAAEEMDKEVDR